MMDSADPLTGWPLIDIWHYPNTNTRHDLYGALFFYLQDRVRKFIDIVRRGKFQFQLLCKDARQLPSLVKSLGYGKTGGFDRIEASHT